MRAPEYERVLRASDPRELETGELIKALEHRGLLSWAERKELDGVWKIRNFCVHSGEEPDTALVERMIEHIRGFRPRLGGGPKNAGH